jgi:hypothetical protein
MADVDRVREERPDMVSRGTVVNANRDLAYLKAALLRAAQCHFIADNRIATAKKLKEDPRQGPFGQPSAVA